MIIKSTYKYVILWWWLNWLSTAYKLSEKALWDVLVIEKDKVLWWLAKSVLKNDDVLDNGSHRLQSSYDQKVLNFFKDELWLKLLKLKRESKLNIKGWFISYPIKSFELFNRISFLKATLSLLWSFYYKLIYINKNSFKKAAKSRVWSYIYKIFYKSYANKVWQIDLDKLSSSVVKKRFTINPIKLFRQLFFKHNSTFLYPKWWFWEIINVLEIKIIENKVDIITNPWDYKIDLEKNTIFIDWETIKYENLISTIPLDNFINITSIEVDKKDSVSYRGLYLLFLYLDKEPKLNWETFYFPSEEFIFGRVSIPKIFNNKSQKKNNYTVYCIEIPSYKDEKEKDDMIKSTFDWLVESWLITRDFKIDYNKTFFSFEKNVYPMYHVGWEEKIIKLLNTYQSKYKNLYFNWRQWLFLHCNVDHVMKLWFELGEYLKENEDNKDWLSDLDKYFGFVVRD